MGNMKQRVAFYPGYRMDTKYVFQPTSGADLPPVNRVGAVFVLALWGDQILAVKNERGWDIPGGHLEAQSATDRTVTRR